MKKAFIVLFLLLAASSAVWAVPYNVSVSQDYDLSFESILRKKFKSLLNFTALFEGNDDFFYRKKFRPIYLLSRHEVYDYKIPELVSTEPSVPKKVVYERIELPNTYNISLSGKNDEGSAVSFNTQNSEILNFDSIEQNGDFEKIKQRYQKILSKTPDRIEILYKYAQFLQKNNKNKEAIAVLKDIIAKDKNFVLASYALGGIYFDLGDYYNAIKANLDVIKCNPYCADAYFNIALSLEKMNKFNLAIDYYQKCLSVNSDDTQAQEAIRRLEELSFAKEDFSLIFE